jgi:hypothetical protein
MIPSIVKHLRRLRADERGTVAVIMGVLIIPLVGALGIGFEVSNWYMITRGMQNAADAAVIAAATNGGTNFDVEAKAVAAAYGFVDGANNIRVVPLNNVPCPDGKSSTCYSVRIWGYTPLLLSQVVGFTGDTTLNGTLEKKLSSAAVANATPQNICMLALASSKVAQGIRTNGAPTGSMNGCDSMSNTGAQCNGHDLGLGISFAVGSNSGCGAKQVPSPPLADPYNYLKSLIPPLSSSGCGGNYPQETKHGNAYSVAASNQLSGSLPLSAGNNFKCGDQMLTANTVINTPLGSPAVLVIENGQLDLNGFSLTTSSGSAVTLVFSGDNSGSYIHAPTDNTNGNTGVLDITAPALATPSTPSNPSWSGVAIYQDPSLTSGLDVSAAGNSPTWNISGLIYMPHASVTLKGAVDKSTAGKSCLVMVADNFQISGTGGVLKTDIGQCGQAGLTMPTANGRLALVL